jgi:three-Cys-motif partner protein
MAKKNSSAKEIMYPHSQAKLDYYQSYLKRYLPILRLAGFTEKIYIFDVFCGTGIYEDGTKGSPILAFEAIKNSYYNLSGKSLTPVCLCANDLDSDKINGVKKYLSDKNKKKYCDLGFYNKDASEFLDQIVKFVDTQNSASRNLVLIDPYGYKNIKKADLRRLLSKKNTEIILFLPISNIYRFSGKVLQETDKCIVGLRDFIYSFFPDENHPMRNGKASCEKEFIEHIRTALNFDDEYYSTSFYLQRDNKGHYFAMFSITSNLKGLEKIVEVKWNLNDETGEGFELPKPMLGLFDDEFKEKTRDDQFNKLKNLVVDFISNKSIVNNKELYEFTLRNMFLIKHCNEVLKDLQKMGKIAVFDVEKNREARKGAFYLSYNNFTSKNVKVNISLN